MVDVTQPPQADPVWQPKSPDDPTDYKAMLEEVCAREKVIKEHWWDKTKEIYPTYEGKKAASTPFNILYSNTEILVPNLFSAPKPVVRRRFGDERADDPARAAERMSEYCMDTNLSGYPDFVDAMEACVMDAALPGQGQSRVRVVSGIGLIDYVQHDEFIWGYAKRWEDTPWIAYISHKTKEDVVREFKLTPEQAALVTATSDGTSESRDKGPATVAVYEVWNKLTRCVYFLSDAFQDAFIQKLEDPLALSGFFPSGKPLRLLSTPVSTMPQALYNLYRPQADELNKLTLRIRKVVDAIKVRGVIDASLPEFAQLFSESTDDNTLVPATQAGVMSREGGLDKHIWMIPIDKLAVVLQQLYQAREQVKSTIYEILGIGDILRGVTQASETASAQQIKDKWGSLRIKKSRERVSNFVRWQIRALIEVSAKHVPEENWAKITGLPFMNTLQVQTLQQAQTMGAPIPPAVASKPSWATVLSTLRDDLSRSYTVDIESNSTVDGDATEDKQEVAEFMAALGQAMPVLDGLGAQGPQGFEAAKALLIDICTRFRMGENLTRILATVQPKPQGPTPEQQKAQDDLEKKSQEVTKAEEGLKAQQEALQAQFEQQKAQLEQIVDQIKQAQASLADKDLDLERQKASLERMLSDIDVAKKELTLEQEKLAISKQALDVHAAAKNVETQAKAAEVAAREKAVASPAA